MDTCGYAPALQLLQLMHAFMSEKQAQRVPVLDGASAVTCSRLNGISEGHSFLFSANGLKFRSAQEVFDAAIAYLARPSLTRILQPPPHATHLSLTSDLRDSEISPVLLVIMGADSLPLVQDASTAFIHSWHAAGCRRIVITGGIGRATPDLIKSFKKRSAHVDAGSDHTKSDSVSLPFAHALGGPQMLPFLHDYSSFSVSWRPAVVAQYDPPPLPPPSYPLVPFLVSTIRCASRYVTEADIFAEVVLEALQGAGIAAKCLRSPQSCAPQL